MNNFISKFNLYELFRILLPGFYIICLFYLLFQKFFNNHLSDFNIFINSLIIFIFALIIGGIIYAMDLPYLFRKCIPELPTNLMKQYHPGLYGQLSDRMIEHEYYEWYENSELKSKTKTERLSGIYHLAVNFAIISFVGILLSALIILIENSTCTKTHISAVVLINFCLFVLSTFLAILIVRRRLRHQWFRNYLEFRVSRIPSEIGNI